MTVYPLQRPYVEINVYPGKFVISVKSRAASSRFEPADAAFISMIRPKGVRRRAKKLARIQYSLGQIIPGVCQHRLISRDAIKYTQQILPYRGANSLLNDMATERTEKCNRPSPPPSRPSSCPRNQNLHAVIAIIRAALSSNISYRVTRRWNYIISE